MKSDYLFFEGVAKNSARTARREIWEGKENSPKPTPELAGRMFASVLGAANLRTEFYRVRALHRRTAACLRFFRVATTDDACQRIERDPRLAQAALDVVLLGVSDFFRDGTVFDRLRDTFLPSLLARWPRLRIWSAACSTGQELYSAAILLAESGQLHKCELLGTDCRSVAIDHAQRGVFAVESTLRLDADRKARFFEDVSGGLQVHAELRNATRWKTADLFAEIEPGPWHLIFWRNMAIYLQTVPAEKLWRGLTDALAPGGLIVTGKADHPPVGLPLVRLASCIYQKIEP